jgi:hypothetical protein
MGLFDSTGPVACWHEEILETGAGMCNRVFDSTGPVVYHAGMKRFWRQAQECVIVFFTKPQITACRVKARGTKTKQTRNKNTGLKPKLKSEENME